MVRRYGLLVASLAAVAARSALNAQVDTIAAISAWAVGDVRLSARVLTALHRSGKLVVFDPPRGAFYTFTEDSRWTPSARQFAGPPLAEGWEGMGFSYDTLWLWDASTRHMVLLDLALQVIRVDTTRLWPRTIAGSEFRPRARSPRGGIVAEETGTLNALAELMARGRSVLLLDRQGLVTDTIWRLDHSHVALIFATSDGGAFAVRQPWASPDLFNVSPSGDLLVKVSQPSVVDANDASIRVTLRHSDGRPLEAFTMKYTPQPFREQITEALLDELAASRALERFADPGAVRREIQGAMYRPRFLPAATKLLVASRGDVWLREFTGADTQTWTVLDRGGQMRARVVFPADVDVRAVTGKTAWVLTRMGDHLQLALYNVEGL